MLTILLKEIRSFFSSLTGYIAIVIFLLVNAWFMWIGPGEFNVLDGGYANLDTLFIIAPWVFLFLLPAVTMRSFAEEKKSGTLELLLTKPVTRLQLIVGKYLAAVVLALFALLPTLLYYYSIYQLGHPVGNLDSGAIWGSYIGLICLAASYAAIGICMSIFTTNQIVAYILTAVLCFFCYAGFDGLSQLADNSAFGNIILSLGINEHYQSISRGVVDSRDLLYFLSLIIIFLGITHLQINSWRPRLSMRFCYIAAALLLLNFMFHNLFFRIDLTGDKRYTLAAVSKETVKSLTGHCLVEVFLEGEMPVSVRKLRTTIKETLDELKVYAGHHIQYDFIDIEKEAPEGNPENIYIALHENGLVPFVVQENIGGTTSERILFPGAIITYICMVKEGDSTFMEKREIPINFMHNDAQSDPEANILLAQQNVEYELVNAIACISREEYPHIAFVEGHGELDEYEAGDIGRALSDFCYIDRINIQGRLGILDNYALVIIAKPMEEWSEADKFVVDQYIMRGGRVAWFVDAAHVHHDSLARGYYTFALAAQHRLEDQLFRYGVRLNPNIVQDLKCSYLPVNIAPAGHTTDYKPAAWPYYPLLTPPDNSAITRGLNLIMSQYPGSIDTVNIRPDVHKTYLLYSSEYSKATQVPLRISLTETNQQYTPEQFPQSRLPVAVLMEGSFPSAFENRPIAQYVQGQAFRYINKSEPAKLVVVADGDIIRNEVHRRADGDRIYRLGFDRYTNIQFGNKNFVKNIVYYLLGDETLMQLRSREWELRLLDKRKVKQQRSSQVAVNTIAPPLFVILIGLAFMWVRKRKYGI
ncbi:MAG: gliding motility-associated ABC transporter substrate-binding protein GldG [Bacteroidales bacterium]|nr:gliding motility-associated ABC transporter substrate-binding protein GldG [Bacteroidales bacterium]MCL2133516.1 gliding motility-associated ABC transporter substrate-binding protein GldG [Bacteroidales bacterium]